MNVVAVVYPSRMDRTGIGGNRRWVTWGSDLLRFQLCCIEEYRVHLEEQLGNTDRHNWSEREKRGPLPRSGCPGQPPGLFPSRFCAVPHPGEPHLARGGGSHRPGIRQEGPGAGTPGKRQGRTTHRQ